MQVTRSKLLRRFALSLGVGFLAVACSVNRNTTTPPADSAPVDLDKPLKVGTAPPFPPFEMKDAQGELVGFDIDLLTAISEQTGQTFEIETLAFEEIIPALQDGRLDAAISAISVTPERSQAVDFSHPYLDAGLVIAVRQNEQAISSEADLEGKTLAVQLNTAGASQAIEIMGSKIIPFSTADEAIAALVEGRADAVIHDKPAVLHAIATQNLDTVRLLKRPLTYQVYGIALPPESPHTATLNEAIETLVENGTYTQIYEKWFGTAAAKVP
ncbi:basic amino acid ABC transporter substrate-binding protein [Pseudanabaena sp. FACHB-2040]|uniref:basic amino acid ABC transporter substrate-binding protein n=1 Tax=Pseudanabaena sp. FACHB-2040 TaxID=2692859 RepID=UPI0016895F5E|nr:basic amino acid ABC transporter substrate-binding protein [Pseudanabaena sp. FACHB-2040]MBD2257145.1 basic amino acid ABC transporter substrate-binding protein [Pseudanabaena sp. FACHB-2040]